MQANISASTLLSYRRWTSHLRLKVVDNMCLSIFRIGSLVFSRFFRSGEINDMSLVYVVIYDDAGGEARRML
jgi:hypothetical protein